jgi:hypothetical protein
MRAGSRFSVPVLAIYRSFTMEQALKDYPPRNDQERAALNRFYAGRRAILSRWQRDLLAGVPTARIVEIPEANLYMFLSNEADVPSGSTCVCGETAAVNESTDSLGSPATRAERMRPRKGPSITSASPLTSRTRDRSSHRGRGRTERSGSP